MASGVLQHVTNKKLAKLQVRQAKFEDKRQSLLSYPRKDEDVLEYTRQLLRGIKDLQLTIPGISLQNVELFLTQAKHDASVPTSTVLQWRKDLERLLATRSSTYKFASLFGKLVTEWLENPNEANRAAQGDDFEHVGRKEMHDQRQKWESIVFTAHEVDVKALKPYFTSLFGSDKPEVEAEEVTAFDRLRKAMKNLRIEPLTVSTLKATIDGVVKNDLFAGEKRDALLDLKERETVLAEVVDVLNMSLKPLKDWSWETAAVPVFQRRQVNGKYRFFMDEEIHQALLLDYIGTSMAGYVTKALVDFRSEAWVTSNTTAMSKEDIRRRAFYLQQISGATGRGVAQLEKPPSLGIERDSAFEKDYFLTQMPKGLGEGTCDYNGSNERDNVSDKKTPIGLKQDLMEMMTTDMLIDLHTKGEFCVLQSDFSWFGPSLPHATILELLQFFGFENHIIDFCKTFLEAPLRFAQDGPDGAVQVRKSGAAMSHTLSDTIGELLLFCLDHAVNAATNGGKLYRMHDDLWFWGAREQCNTAWRVIREFTAKTGLQLNDEKSGSCYMTWDDNDATMSESDDTTCLPQGYIKWGFLVLSPTTRKWEIDQAQVQEHTAELRLQLCACRSVLSFIHAWNSYVSRFFTTNFGRAANCHGASHLKAVIATFELIQRDLFPSGSVTSHLKTMIASRFDEVAADSIPTGFLYFPVDLGGLDLKNPFIPLLARLHEKQTEASDDNDKKDGGGHVVPAAPHLEAALEPTERLRLVALRDRHDYDRAKARFDRDRARFREVDGWVPDNDDDDDDDDDDGDGSFFSFAEFMRFAAETSPHLAAAARTLRRQPPEVDVSTDAIQGHLAAVQQRLGPRGACLQTYDRWILALYGPEMVDVFGACEVCDRELLPVGLVKMLRSERVRWQG